LHQSCHFTYSAGLPMRTRQDGTSFRFIGHYVPLRPGTERYFPGQGTVFAKIPLFRLRYP
jgi:hypothetical protein